MLSAKTVPAWLRRAASTFTLGVTVVAVVALAGCAVGPNFHPPQMAMPGGWAGATPETTAPSPQAVELARWWQAFNDPALGSLVDRAIESNLDLRQAASRVRQARAARTIAASALWPTLSLGGSGTRSLSGGGSSNPRTGPSASTLWQIGLDASWEIDVFGGTRRNVEAADAGLLAAIEDGRDVLVTSVAEVALDYIDLRGFQQQSVIAQENLKAQRKSADLTRQRFEGGFVGGFDVANAQVSTTLAQNSGLRDRGPPGHLQPEHPAGARPGGPAPGTVAERRHSGGAAPGAVGAAVGPAAPPAGHPPGRGPDPFSHGPHRRRLGQRTGPTRSPG